jgi:hypothetical protein
MLLTASLVAIAQSTPAQTKIIELHLRAKIEAVVPLASFSGQVTPVDLDPRFALTLRAERVEPIMKEFVSGAVITFAIHSPSLLFAGDPSKGGAYDFNLRRETTGTKVRFFDLRVEENQMSASEKEHILDGSFTVVSRTDGIPANVKQAFSTITRQTSFAMANPGEAFQVTDVVLYRRLPWRRLVFAGVQGDLWFLHYEHGGLAHSYYVVALKADSHGGARFVWGCGVGESAKTLEQLRTMVATCRLADAESYW